MGGWYARSFIMVLLLSVGMHFAHTFVDVQSLEVSRSRSVESSLIQDDRSKAVHKPWHGGSRQGYSICLLESTTMNYTIHRRASRSCALSAPTYPLSEVVGTTNQVMFEGRRSVPVPSSVGELTVLFAIVVVISF